MDEFVGTYSDVVAHDAAEWWGLEGVVVLGVGHVGHVGLLLGQHLLRLLWLLHRLLLLLQRLDILELVLGSGALYAVRIRVLWRAWSGWWHII